MTYKNRLPAGLCRRSRAGRPHHDDRSDRGHRHSHQCRYARTAHEVYLRPTGADDTEIAVSLAAIEAVSWSVLRPETSSGASRT